MTPRCLALIVAAALSLSGCNFFFPHGSSVRGEPGEEDSYVYGCNGLLDTRLPVIMIPLEDWDDTCTLVASQWLEMSVSPKPIPGVLDTYTVLLNESDDDAEDVEFITSHSNFCNPCPLPALEFQVYPGGRTPQRIETTGDCNEPRCVDVYYEPVVDSCGLVYNPVLTPCDDW